MDTRVPTQENEPLGVGGEESDREDTIAVTEPMYKDVEATHGKTQYLDTYTCLATPTSAAPNTYGPSNGLLPIECFGTFPSTSFRLYESKSQWAGESTGKRRRLVSLQRRNIISLSTPILDSSKNILNVPSPNNPILPRNVPLPESPTNSGESLDLNTPQLETHNLRILKSMYQNYKERQKLGWNWGSTSPQMIPSYVMSWANLVSTLFPNELYQPKH